MACPQELSIPFHHFVHCSARLLRNLFWRMSYPKSRDRDGHRQHCAVRKVPSRVMCHNVMQSIEIREPVASRDSGAIRSSRALGGGIQPDPRKRNHILPRQRLRGREHRWPRNGSDEPGNVSEMIANAESHLDQLGDVVTSPSRAAVNWPAPQFLKQRLSLTVREPARATR